jgi:hypothetical protein
MSVNVWFHYHSVMHRVTKTVVLVVTTLLVTNLGRQPKIWVREAAPGLHSNVIVWSVARWKSNYVCPQELTGV